MKRFYLFTILSIAPLLSMAQDKAPATASFTLEQCIKYALENSIRSKNAALDQDIAKAKVNETIGIGLPQISATSSLVNNPQLHFWSEWSSPKHI